MAHINTDFGGDEFHSVELKDMSQQQAAHELHSINAQSDPLQFRSMFLLSLPLLASSRHALLVLAPISYNVIMRVVWVP